jgi:uncharacterized protein
MKTKQGFSWVLIYLLLVLILAALLAPWLVVGAEGMIRWGEGQEWLKESSVYQGLKKSIDRASFQRFYNRSVLIVALILLPWILGKLKIQRRELQFLKWKVEEVGMILRGFGLATGILMGLGMVYLWLGVYRLKDNMELLKIGSPFMAAIGAGLLEEWLFRGVIHGILLRTMGVVKALFWSAGFFAFVHFFKAPVDVVFERQSLEWWSGLVLLKEAGLAMARPLVFLSEGLTLFAVGWVLFLVRQVTGKIWWGLGLHVGWVFALKYFSGITNQALIVQPWVGGSLKEGVCSLVLVWLTGYLSVSWLKKIRSR